MSASEYVNGLQDIITRFNDTQQEAIAQAAGWVADAVEAERFGVLFGTGHSYMAVSDTFPRIGSFPAWLPIQELCTSYLATVSGNQGLRQSMFLERVHGFAEIILENYRLDPRDVMIVISNSGVNPVPIEMALKAREMGLRTVAVTSLAHSQASASRHKSGQRLFEACDLAIDTCMPQGDALVNMPGFPGPVGAGSTIMSLIVMQTLSTAVAHTLAQRGISLPVYPSHNARMSPDEHARVEGMAEAVMAEYTRRTAGILK
jgi:uncharacterized phosphosugar-binding protein